MRAVVVYDSVYGNTRQIAEGIGRGLGGGTETLHASTARSESVRGVDMLVVGSPTQGGRPTQPVQSFIASLQAGALEGVWVASFDTRYSSRFVKMFGFAADRIARGLEAKGGTLVKPAEPFFVGGKKGPLREGEQERAVEWGRTLAELAASDRSGPEEK